MAGNKLVIHPMGDVTVVNFADTSILDTAQIEEIGKELYRLTDELDKKKILLDFSKVQFMSSSAIGVLITLRKKATANKGNLVICGMKKELMKVFEIMNLKKLFQFAANETEALSALGVTTGR